MRYILPSLAPLLMLAACSGGSTDQAEAQADTLDNAAAQSTPEAAEVLESQADAIRANGSTGAAGEPGSTVQQAAAEAGQAQTGNTAGEAPATPAPPSKQASPHGAGKGNPPPKVETR